jgi:hypothetical protein
MRIAEKRKPGVYVEFRDRLRQRKSESVTVDGVTPKQAVREFVRFIREKLRRAG